MLELELRHAWEDLETHQKRRQEAQENLERLYDEARVDDPNLPEPTQGVLTKIKGARLVAELGPMRDFDNLSQVYRFLGMNLVERQSGRYRGKTKSSKKGRRLGSKVTHQIAFSLSKKDRLFGTYYHGKKEKMEGTKAMTAVARKYVRMFWGWYKSGKAFDPNRVFACESQMPKAA